MRVILKAPGRAPVDSSTFISWMLPSPGDKVWGYWGDATYTVKERTYVFSSEGAGSNISIELQ